MRHLMCFTAMLLLGACAQSDRVDRAEELNFGTCEAVVKKLAKKSSSAKIPRVKPIKKRAGRIQYSWKHGSGLAFQNGFSAMIDVSAECLLLDGKLDEISFNGEWISGADLDHMRLTAAMYRVKNAKK